MSADEEPITVWTWEPGGGWFGEKLHLIPPDPWDTDRVLCGPRSEEPGILGGYEIQGKPDLDNWPKNGCLRCKRVYARRDAANRIGEALG